MDQEVVAFGEIRVDFRRMSAWRGAEELALEPKTFDVLRYLIDHRDRLVTKEELLDAVWKDTFVTPNVLTRAVAQLRKAMGDDAFEARYIETVSRRGYRFIAPVAPASLVQPVPSEPTRPAGRTISRRAALAGAAAAGLVVAVSILALNRNTAHESAPVPVATASPAPRRLTTEDRLYALPALSPDGRTMAYSSRESGSLEIYTAALAPNSREMALTSDGGQNGHPSWSPDGQWIAYFSRGKGGIWIVPSGGGTSRQVANFGSQPVWSADGQRVFFRSNTGGMAAQSNLWSVHRDGTDLKPFTTLGKPKGGHSQPAVSSDGRLLAFSVSQGLINVNHEMWLVPVSGGEPFKVGMKTPYGDLQFAPDNRSLYWTSRTSEGNESLMRMALDDRGLPAGEPETVVTFTGYLISRFSIARDGTALVGLFRGIANLWAVDFSAERAEPPAALMTDEVRNSQPRHSRDGRLAFHQFTVGRPTTTWVADEDGRHRESLTPGLSSNVAVPQWSSDGRRLFVTTGQGSSSTFAWLDVATRSLTPVPVSASGVFSARLSPDDKEIAFHTIQDDGALNVWRQPLDGGPRRQITFDKEAVSYPVWTNDGKSLVVEIKRGESTYIGVIPREGGKFEMLVGEEGQNWPFSLSPDDQFVAFAGERNGVWNVYTVSRRTKAIRQLTRFTTAEGYVRYPSWSFTRSRIVFERAEEKSSVWTLTLR
jgi:Tol biopolymer transport system component/DNA-binding winged helix-turn-helix (wHTH) protein